MVRKIKKILFSLFVGILIITSYDVYTQEYPMPVFDSILIDDGNDLVFPSVIKANDHFKNPIGNYYMYTAPHRGASIKLYYSDAINGPWKLYGTVIDSIIGRSHHVSSPSAIWNEEIKELFVYVHAPNSKTIWTTSKDGMNFNYGGIAVSRDDLSAHIGYECKAASYGRVYKYSIPTIGNKYAMSISAPGMGKGDTIRKSIALATSADGKKWTVRPKPLIESDPDFGKYQCMDAHYFPWKNKHYFVYSLRSRINPRTDNVKLHISEVDENWENQVYRGIFYEGRSGYPDFNNVRGNTFVRIKNSLYMIYEAGEKHNARIAIAKIDME